MKRAITTFHGAGGVTVSEGLLLPDDHEIVTAHADLFEDASEAVERLMRAAAPVTFGATSNPIEVRAEAEPAPSAQSLRRVAKEPEPVAPAEEPEPAPEKPKPKKS